MALLSRKGGGRLGLVGAPGLEGRLSSSVVGGSRLHRGRLRESGRGLLLRRRRLERLRLERLRLLLWLGIRRVLLLLLLLAIRRGLLLGVPRLLLPVPRMLLGVPRMLLRLVRSRGGLLVLGSGLS